MEGIHRAAAEDGTLLAEVASGRGDDAFPELVRRYKNFVYRICRRITGDGAEAEDAAQQVFLILSEKAGELSARTSLSGWLYRTAWQVSVRSHRSAATRRKHERAAAKPELTGPTGLAGETDAAQLHAVIQQLPDVYQEAIVLHYFQGFTVAETASRMRCPSGTVASRISRGLQLIRARMTDRGLVLTATSVKLLLMAESRIVRAAFRAAVPAVVGALAPLLKKKVTVRVFAAGTLAAMFYGTRVAVSAPLIALRTFSFGVPITAVWSAIRFTPAARNLSGIPNGAKVAAAVIAAALFTPATFAAFKYAPAAIADKTSVSTADGAGSGASTGLTTPGNDDKSAAAAPEQRVGGGASAVPEPSSAAIFCAIGSLTLYRRRPGSARPV